MKDYDKLVNLSKTAIKKEKSRNYTNIFSNKYYVHRQNSKNIWKNVMNIKEKAKVAKIECNFDELYVNIKKK